MKQQVNLSEFRTLRKLIEGKVVLEGKSGKIFMVKPFEHVTITDHFVPFDYCLVTYDNGVMFIGRERSDSRKQAILKAKFNVKYATNNI